MTSDDFDPEDVLAFWFPATGHQDSIKSHGAFWDDRMQGGMDAVIHARFADLTWAAAKGRLDHWAGTPRRPAGASPRSLWRDMPAAFAQDIKAARLAQEGIANVD